MPPSQCLSLIKEFKQRAQAALPGRISRVVLFGSRARGEERADSDWDVAVFLKGSASSWDTMALADVAYDLIVESGEFIQPIALSEQDDMRGLLSQDIEADGIAL